MTTKATKTTTRNVAKRDSTPSLKSEVPEERIRTRAYEIHLARAGSPGDAQSDWLQAERELNGPTDSA
ncbi:MAG: DUF2934 domain-containing protein [Phycisphaerae bacterium]